MGKIKSRLVKRTASILSEKGIEFSEAFERNKKILGSTMPSKKMRNQMAGHCSRVEKFKRIKEEVLKAIK